MGIEQLHKNEIVITPGPFDVHMHPRVTDGITEDAFVEINGGIEGKAGLKAYTEAALWSGIVGGCAMPNEMMRRYAPDQPEKTEVIPWPISDLRAVQAMQSAIQQHARIPMGVFFGIDPAEIFPRVGSGYAVNLDIVDQRFAEVKDDVLGLKLWGDLSTGGFNMPVQDISRVADRWYEHNPEKPIILHVEDGNVAKALQTIKKEIPVHVAHVSSRQELQAVIDAKKEGKNVTCEVTVHHLFLDESVCDQIGGYGCMKPSLKPQEDIDFLWANMDSIDIFASDCAPHRRSDKEGKNPAFGVTNHTVMLPLLLGAVSEGRLTYDDIFQKFCVAPRQRFNLPVDDNSRVEVILQSTDARLLETVTNPAYGQNPFLRLAVTAPMIGSVIMSKAGVSNTMEDIIEPSYSHLLAPRTVNGNS